MHKGATGPMDNDASISSSARKANHPPTAPNGHDDVTAFFPPSARALDDIDASLSIGPVLDASLSIGPVLPLFPQAAETER